MEPVGDDYHMSLLIPQIARHLADDAQGESQAPFRKRLKSRSVEILDGMLVSLAHSLETHRPPRQVPSAPSLLQRAVPSPTKTMARPRSVEFDRILPPAHNPLPPMVQTPEAGLHPIEPPRRPSIGNFASASSSIQAMIDSPGSVKMRLFGPDHVSPVPETRQAPLPTVHEALYPALSQSYPQLVSPITPLESSRMSPTSAATVPQEIIPVRLPGSLLTSAELTEKREIVHTRTSSPKPQSSKPTISLTGYAPSKHCHICTRAEGLHNLVVCGNIRRLECKKVICRKCFAEQGWNFHEAKSSSGAHTWVCSHCERSCPARAQCKTYKRVNDQRKRRRAECHSPS